jgi:hypothetical protein
MQTTAYLQCEYIREGFVRERKPKYAKTVSRRDDPVVLVDDAEYKSGWSRRDVIEAGAMEQEQGYKFE